MTQHVLIVDDTDINLILFTALINKLGNCEVHAFSDPREGLAWATLHVADLIIVDYMMPDIDGLEFIRQVREMPGRESLPILMITANDQKQLRYRALDLGANDFLIKPVDKVEFLARSKNMLSLSEATRKLADRADWLAEEVRKATSEIVARERETVFQLCKAAEYRDPETGAHIMRMAHFSCLIARELGLSEADQELLLEAAPLHDLGKVGIADAILLKPGRLNPAEFEVMKQHAMYGHELLKDSMSRVLQAGSAIALTHHEKFDGSGYPKGLQGEEIPIFGRIVAVADVFDALTSDRPYKMAWSLEESVDFLKKGRGSHFDPTCVDAFLKGWSTVLEIRERYKEDD